MSDAQSAKFPSRCSEAQTCSRGKRWQGRAVKHCKRGDRQTCTRGGLALFTGRSGGVHGEVRWRSRGSRQSDKAPKPSYMGKMRSVHGEVRWRSRGGPVSFTGRPGGVHGGAVVSHTMQHVSKIAPTGKPVHRAHIQVPVHGAMARKENGHAPSFLLAPLSA